MQIIKYLIVFLFLLPSVSYSQWITKNGGTSEFLTGIYFLDNQRGWIVCTDCCLLTIDGGASWQKKVISSGNIPFYAVEFVNSDIGITTSNNGIIYRSTNGGNSWYLINTQLGSISYFGISYLEDYGRHTWIVGTSETIAYSSNNGSSWIVQHTGSFALYNVYFVNKDIGWAVGKYGIILHTSQGGQSKSWSSQMSSTQSDLYGVCFYDSLIGWTVGANGIILKTDDGGQTWRQQNSGTNLILNKVSFIDDKNGVVIGENGIILHTKDGGNHWSNESGIVNTILYGLYYQNIENCWIVGQNGVILYSQGSLFIKSPNDGSYEVGFPLTITWDSNYIEKIAIEFSYDNAASWSTIEKEGLAIPSEYSWNDNNTVSKTCRLKIRSLTKSSVENISLPFEIYQKYLKLRQLPPDTILDAGSNFIIKWAQKNMDHDNLKIMLRERPNSSLMTIKESIPAAILQHDWEVFNVNSDQCRMLIKELDGSPIDSSAFFTIRYITKAPDIEIDTSKIQARKEQDLLISAIISSEYPTNNTLYYCQGGNSSYRDKSMVSISFNEYQATILAHEGDDFSIDERGLEWYVKAVDTSPSRNDTTFGSPEKSIYSPVMLDSLKFIIESSVPGEDVYQMVSIPYKLYDTKVGEVFRDFESNDPHKWRLWTWSSINNDYEEIKSGNIERGKSYWLASTNNKFKTGKGQSYKPENFPIRLESGWNQISNPFAFPISYADIIAANDTSGLGPFHAFDETIGWPPVAVLEPKTGYFIKNSKQNEVVLKILPIATATPSGYLTRPKFSVNEWEMKLIINSEHVIDAYNFLGIYQTAHPEWDHFDYPEPPPAPGKYVSLYFPHQDWKKYPDNYTTDFRPTIEEGQVWDFVVASNIANSKAKIRFEGIEFIPGELEVMLIDEIFTISQDLRQNPEYSFPILSNTFSKQLKIAIGNSEYFKKIVLPEYEIPGNFELSQNFPNPFNRATVIRYGLPVSGKVTIKIFNVIGEEIITLEENNQRNAGYHVLIWNGIDRNGNMVPNGLYFFQMCAEGSYTRTVKIIIIK